MAPLQSNDNSVEVETTNGNSDARTQNVIAVANGKAKEPPNPDFDLDKVLTVLRGTKAFDSSAISRVSLPKGSFFAPLSGLTSGAKAYSSVQINRNEHTELNSNLVFCNHSCDPSLEFDVTKREVRVSRDRDLKEGDALTFWYPSTEWSMAQPFECDCGTERCLKWISGAGDMDESVLKGYWLNEHIVQMLAEKAKNGVTNGH